MRITLITAALLAAMILISCGGDDDQPPTSSNDSGIAALVGTWNIEIWEHSLASDTSQKVDWVVTMGLSGSLTITQDGAFTVTPALDGGFGSDFGDLTVQADSIYWDGENDEEWVRFELKSPLLILYWPETSFVDMDQDGTPEDTWLRVVLRRT